MFTATGNTCALQVYRKIHAGAATHCNWPNLGYTGQTGAVGAAAAYMAATGDGPTGYVEFGNIKQEWGYQSNSNLTAVFPLAFVNKPSVVANRDRASGGTMFPLFP